jgi:urease accessory protein
MTEPARLPAPLTGDRLTALLHLASSALPVGSYAYSQGLEWAVEEGLVKDPASLHEWLASLLELQLAHQELPVLMRLHAAFRAGRLDDAQRWNARLIALRETAELRLEELARGQSLLRLLHALDLGGAWPVDPAGVQRITFTAAFAMAAAGWEIDATAAAHGWAWAWLETQVIAGVKLIPLGQLDGQRLLLSLRDRIADVVGTAARLEDTEVGMTAVGLALASTAHESQYTRLFRS